MRPNPQEIGMATYFEEIINGKLYFLCSDAVYDCQ